VTYYYENNDAYFPQ